MNHPILNILQKERCLDKPLSLLFYFDLEPQLDNRQWWETAGRILKKHFKKFDMEVRRGRHYFADNSYMIVYYHWTEYSIEIYDNRNILRAERDNLLYSI